MIIEHRAMAWWRWRVLVAALLAAGCTKPNPRSCQDGTCTEPGLPFCDVDGALAGEPETCIAVDCTPGEFASCRGDLAVTCNATGSDYDLTQCERGCEDGAGCRLCEPNETACVNGAVATCDAQGNVTMMEPCPLGCFESEPRCRLVEPSNGLATYLDMSATAPELDYTDLRFDTSTGAVQDGSTGSDVLVPSFVASNPGGPSIRVFMARRATLRTVYAFSSGADLAFALVSTGEIVVVGPVFANSGSPAAGCNAGPARAVSFDNGNDGYTSGSGGGGNATVGGAGGGISSYMGGIGGAIVGTPELVPLQGGCPSGPALVRHYTQSTFGTAASPSRGGGALQLVSATSITVEGMVNVRGWQGEIEAAPGYVVVWGGGAGGGILLEAPVVTLGPNAKLIAKGGGGGAAGPSVGYDDSAAPQPGLQCSGPGCSSGGNGATHQYPAGTASNVSTDGIAGGGGGGLGRVRINTETGTYDKSSSTLESAAVTTGVLSTR